MVHKIGEKCFCLFYPYLHVQFVRVSACFSLCCLPMYFNLLAQLHSYLPAWLSVCVTSSLCMRLFVTCIVLRIVRITWCNERWHQTRLYNHRLIKLWFIKNAEQGAETEASESLTLRYSEWQKWRPDFQVIQPFKGLRLQKQVILTPRGQYWQGKYIHQTISNTCAKRRKVLTLGWRNRKIQAAQLGIKPRASGYVHQRSDHLAITL